MTVSEYGAEQWAGIMFGLASPPATFYIALCTDEPGEGWDGTVLATVEPQGSVTYLRQPLDLPGDWALSDGGFVINADVLAFPTPDIGWGLITHFALTDDDTAGELWAYGEFVEAIDVPEDYDVALAPGAIQVGVSNLLSSIAE